MVEWDVRTGNQYCTLQQGLSQQYFPVIECLTRFLTQYTIGVPLNQTQMWIPGITNQQGHLRMTTQKWIL